MLDTDKHNCHFDFRWWFALSTTKFFQRVLRLYYCYHHHHYVIIIDIIIIDIITIFIHLFIVMGHQLKVTRIPNSYVAKWHNWWAVCTAFLHRKWSVTNLMLQSAQSIIRLDNYTGRERGSTALICVSEGYPPATMTSQKLESCLMRMAQM